jgi:Ca2+-binding EF-hand superfamily protein
VAPASWLFEQEIAECHETLRAFDKDRNSSFVQEELATVLASTGHVYTKEQFETAMIELLETKETHASPLNASRRSSVRIWICL